MIELLLLAGLVLCAAAFMWSSARVWHAQRSAGRVLAPGPGRDPAGKPRPARVGSGGTGSGGGKSPPGTSTPGRRPEDGHSARRVERKGVSVMSDDPTDEPR
ncbi:MAG: hypothetical protein KA169_01975 [Burkholderiaceae bacterium]|nr:hypothetical protein [Burkholderiaceae bacterium]